MTDPTSNRYWSDPEPDGATTAHTHALELVGHAKRVLELGPAAGHVTRALLDRGCDVVGIEYEPEAAAAVRELTECHVGDVTDPAIIQQAAENGPFEVVLAGDVLEHLHDPLTTLRECRKVLAPGGYVVVSVPNIAHADVALLLATGRFDYRDVGLLDRTHIHFFTFDSIVALLDEAGFAPIDVRRVVQPVFETELGVDRDELDPALVAAVLSHDEAETYQFVIRAVRHDGDEELRDLATKKTDAENRAQRESTERVRAEAEVTRLTAELDRLTAEVETLREDDVGVDAYLEELRLENERLEGLATARGHDLEALQATRILRYTRRLRSAYAWARGRLPG